MIFELLDQYESICRRALFVCGAKFNKTFKTNFELSGINPYKTLNAKLVKELFGIATHVA